MKSILPPTEILIVLLALTCGCVTHQHPGLSLNKEVVRRYFDQWVNGGDPKVADELIAPDLLLRNPPMVLRSREEDKAVMAAFRAAFPEMQYTVEEMIAERDLVVVRWTLRGTQQADYHGQASHGKPVTVTGTSTFRLAEGKIQEIWVNMDRQELMQQLEWLSGTSPAGKWIADRTFWRLTSPERRLSLSP